MSTELEEPQLTTAKRSLDLRVSRFPLQYITGSVEFLGFDFSVGRGVFIPRPETELLANETARRLEGVHSPLVLEIGTGSGVIAVTLALENRAALVFANDISRPAIETARANAEAHGVSERIFFHIGDLLSAIAVGRIGEGVHVLVSNPPYVPSSEIPLLAPEISQHEPTVAIDGGEDGFRCTRAILQQGPAFIAKGGWLLLEIGVNQAQVVRKMATAVGLEDVCTVKDLSGIERILIARKR